MANNTAFGSRPQNLKSLNEGESDSNDVGPPIVHQYLNIDGSKAAAERDNFTIVDLLKSHDEALISPDEERILDQQLLTPEFKTSYLMLYRYATKIDILIIVVSVVCSIASGAVMPLMTIVFGQFGGSFQKFYLATTSTSYFHKRLNQLTLYYLYLGISQFITTYIAFVGFMYTGEHVTQKLREEYLAAVLRQNIALFDKLGAGEITSTITANMDIVLLGVSEKLALTIMALTTFVTALIVGFVKNWRLSFALLSTAFAVLFTMTVFSVFILRFTKRSIDAYAPGTSTAEETLASVRTVTAFNGQSKLADKYEESLIDTMRWGFKTKTVVGGMIATMMLITYLAYALGFWEGSRLLVAGHATLSETLTTLLALLTGAVSIAHATPHIQAFAGAVSAATNIFKIIDRSVPDHDCHGSFIPNTVQGTLEFCGVKHIYPSRPQVTVLHDFNLVVPAGKVTALVGASGSGKSTIVGLTERFYSPVGGHIFLDGHDTQKLDLKWLRRQMSLVSQEPVLFNCTVRANIEHGLIGTELADSDSEKTEELVVQAAKLADAHDFILHLPQGYDTLAGGRGLQLSGGQKQRIAIARAVISNPKILLLDEATSALDSQSEGIVQHALDVASKGRTTIAIAHRLSSIKNADNIVVLDEGRIVEQGSHNELLVRKGAYWELVNAQRISSEKILHGANTDIAKDRFAHNRIQDGQSIDLEKEHIQRQYPTTTTRTRRRSSDTSSHSLWTIIKLVLAFNKEETGIMLVGLLCSILAGGGMPVQGVVFAKCIVSLSLPPTHYADLRRDINYWSSMYLAVGLSVWIVSIGHGVAFAYCSERLIYRARNLTFRDLLRQEVGFFDRPMNSTGSLINNLSKSTVDLAGISGAVLGALLQLTTTIITAIILSCIIGWKLGLVCSSTIPILLLTGFGRILVLGRFQARASKAYSASASLACEAVSAITTIASLTREQDVWNVYHNLLREQLRASLRSILKSSMLYAAAQSFGLFCMALGFWYGGRLILEGEYSMFQLFVCFSSVIFSAQSAGALFAFAPDMAKSREAAQLLKDIWDREPEIDSWSDEGEEIAELEGKVEFRDVWFSYPSRESQHALQGLSFTVEPGQFVALIGASGCGKSTAIGLLERFYDPDAGHILVDGKDISKSNLKKYRSQLALVAQEPVLYSGTIRENVLLAVEGVDVDDRVVEEACRKANIWDFITSLPQALSTPIGTNGALLSGGQKQRVALARALIRNPRILLLDEATSALDSASESVIQEALDEAIKEGSRTTIAVAHRLSTVQGADCIFVIEEGRVVEEGTHESLMRARGVYWEMVGRQGLGD